jgi:hypothetical protein
MNEMEKKYNEITELFSLAEELASTVDHKNTLDNALQMQLVEPLMETLAESGDILTDEFIACCEGKAAKKPASKSRIEGAMRKIYIAMHEYGARVALINKGAVNLADAIVEKVKRQMETVVANFMEFIKLSLDRIMQKHDIDELKQRHDRIAMMLHAQALGQGAN